MKKYSSVILLLVACLIIVIPLVIPAFGGEFAGTDDRATQAIASLKPGYKPWFEPLWVPPSKEIESLLFALQAALGAGLLGYVIGRRHEAQRRNVDH
ncbi:energy-coupling factor ABC transporter substrate-binding protein [Uliginosibacterium gangwonense]|uniref:energy-coupling factor ABC transporter substrate-binding protein n=1 Tax=Uliginosibacterium gangwonense TaxID=392736 RepID=UPI00036A0ACC|nr:energy-coupling factor ABC transporter substrate-binding protein [Uliginosibacterium gangwonense]